MAMRGGTTGKVLIPCTVREISDEQIVAGTKRTEYRDFTVYWRRRLEGRHYDVIQFRNGYATKAPEMVVEFLGVRKYGKGRTGKYAIRLGRILKIKRWKR